MVFTRRIFVVFSNALQRWRSGRPILRDTREDSCDFCDEFAGGKNNAFRTRYGPEANRILFTYGNFSVLPSILQIKDIRGAVDRTSSYLFFETTHRKRFVSSAEYVPSQYVRQLIAHLTGSESWDWRSFGREDSVIATIDRLGFAFGASGHKA